MINALHRFHGHGGLRYVYKNGDITRSRQFVMKSLANPRRKYSRVSVVISKKTLKSAVGRNRVRRRVYEVVRHELPNIEQSKDIALIVVSAEVRDMDAIEMYRTIRELFIKSGVYKNTHNSGILSKV